MRIQNIILLVVIVLLSSCRTIRINKDFELKEVSTILKHRYHKKVCTKNTSFIQSATCGEYIRINYDSATIMVDTAYQEYLSLLTSGLVTKEMLVLGSSDTLFINGIKELSAFRKGQKIRRIKIDSYFAHCLNPTFFLIEVHNNHAKRRTSFEDFIKGSRVTFFTNWLWI
ncbi:MAG: hypothetical protein HXX16_20090 [Bacteroidales bacterium]|nr:hypothetical protein [Bacteroidales bacterium]